MMADASTHSGLLARMFLTPSPVYVCLITEYGKGLRVSASTLRCAQLSTALPTPTNLYKNGGSC